MTQGIYAVYDNKALSVTGVLIMAKTLAVALRIFSDIATPDSPIMRHPEDYDFVHLGNLNENHTAITPNEESLRIVMTGTALAATRQPKLTKEA